MLAVFTTTNPHGFLGGARIELLSAVRKPVLINPENLWSEAYLHGTVQNRAGFDMPVHIDGTFDVTDLTNETEQTSPCEVELADGIKIACTAYLWDTGRLRKEYGAALSIRFCKGLIVANDDSEAIEYAKQKQKERAGFL